MTIQELLKDLGVPSQEVNHMLSEIASYNENHPEKRVKELDLSGDIDDLSMPQMPFIGRAIARVRGDKALDAGGRFPLDVEQNALRYAAFKLDKYYRTGTKDSNLL